MAIDYTPRIWFYAGEEHLASVDHDTPPRVGDHVFIGPPPGSWRVVGVWWQYPHTGSQAYISGNRGGIVTIQCVPGDSPFPASEAD